MSVTTEITVDIHDVEQGLDAMERRAHALGPVMKSLIKPVRDDQGNHRRAKEGPDGAWAPRAASTILRAHGKRKMSRSLLGKLPTAVQYVATAQSVTGTSRVRWSGAHNDPDGARVGRGSRLPGRTFLWLSNELQDLAESTIANALLGAYGGRA